MSLLIRIYLYVVIFKVLEMEEDVEKQRLIRDSLELEIEGLRDRLLTVEDLTDSMTSENSCAAVVDEQLSRYGNAQFSLHIIYKVKTL